MADIHIKLTDNDNGMVRLSHITDTSGTDISAPDIISNILRLRRRKGSVLIWDEGNWDEKVWA